MSDDNQIATEIIHQFLKPDETRVADQTEKTLKNIDYAIKFDKRWYGEEKQFTVKVQHRPIEFWSEAQKTLLIETGVDSPINKCKANYLLVVWHGPDTYKVMLFNLPQLQEWWVLNKQFFTVENVNSIEVPTFIVTPCILRQATFTEKTILGS